MSVLYRLFAEPHRCSRCCFYPIFLFFWQNPTWLRWLLACHKKSYLTCHGQCLCLEGRVYLNHVAAVMIKGPDKNSLRGKRLVLAHSSRETQSITTGKARAGVARGQDRQTGNALCIHTQEADMEVEWTVKPQGPSPGVDFLQ